jgi:DNA polymerase-4
VTERERKSLGVERTLEKDLSELVDIEPILDGVVDLFYKRLTRANSYGRTITLKLKTHDFQLITRSISMDYTVDQIDEIRFLARKLLIDNQDSFLKIRLIGLTASNFGEKPKPPENAQMRLFD